jgi:hypothetical protein
VIAGLNSSGSIRILDASKNPVPASLAEGGPYIRTSLTTRQSGEVRLAPHAPLTTVRAGGLLPFSFTPVPGVAFAVPATLGRTIADASVPGLIPAGRFEPTPASLAAEPRTIQPVAITAPSAGRIDCPLAPVWDKTLRSTVAAVDYQTRPLRRIPHNHARPAAAAIRERIPAASMLSWQDDSATVSQVAPLPRMRIDAVSILKSPSLAATVEAGSSTDHFDLVAQRNSPAKPPAGVRRIPAGSVPRPAACFALDLVLQDIAYAHSGGYSRKSRL